MVTFPKLTEVVPVGAALLPVFLTRNLPAVLVLTVQPDASPRLVGCEAKVDEPLPNPDGVEQLPLAVVQMTASNDSRVVDEGKTKLNVYVVEAEAADEPKVKLRSVIVAAEADPVADKTTNTDNKKETPTLTQRRRCDDLCISVVYH